MRMLYSFTSLLAMGLLVSSVSAQEENTQAQISPPSQEDTLVQEQPTSSLTAPSSTEEAAKTEKTSPIAPSEEPKMEGQEADGKANHLLALAEKEMMKSETAVRDDESFEFGLRLGWAHLLGNAAKGVEISDKVMGNPFALLDLGYRSDRNWYFGIYAQLGPVLSSKKFCKDVAGCEEKEGNFNAQGGANVHYHLIPEKEFDLWVGFGGGYEFLAMVKKIGGEMEDIRMYGPVGKIEVGGDWRMHENVGLGPLLNLVVGRYDFDFSDSLEVDTISRSGEIRNKALHMWLALGFRGTFNIY